MADQTEFFNIKKWFAGFNIFDGVKLAKILFSLILIITVVIIYHNAFKPKTIQMIEKQIVNNCPEEKGVGMSVHLWKLRLSLGL